MEEKRLKSILIVVVVFLVLVGIVFSFLKREPSVSGDITIDGLETDSITDVSDTEETLVVIDISGAVVAKGVYSLPEGSLVWDAINMAGGLVPEADILYIDQNINMAALLVTNQKLYIPYQSDDYSSDEVNSGESGKISINNATQEQLESLPGVGPATAQKIIGNRPYSSLEDLKEVKGIGDSTYEELIEHITL